MITPVICSVPTELLNSAIKIIDSSMFRTAINQPTGDFFYDPWIIKDEFKNTPIEDLYNTLEGNKGEARIVNLDIKSCYIAHADIDDRWHLSLTQEDSFLIDLDNEKMHKLSPNKWYYMNAGIRHSAANFGSMVRSSLLIRKLLTHNELSEPKMCKIYARNKKFNIRYLFDNVYSPVLNNLNKQGLISNFKKHETYTTFDIDQDITLPEHEDFVVEYT